MGAASSANKPDLRICLDYQNADLELAYAEFSYLEAPSRKHREDWKKLVRTCKDGHCLIRDVCFEGKKIDNEQKLEVNTLINLLNGIPIIGLLVKGNHLHVSITDSFNGKFYKSYEILDINIPLGPTDRRGVEDLLKKAIQLKNCMKGIVSEVVHLLDECINLPNMSPIDYDEDTSTVLDTLSQPFTPFTPLKK